MKKFLFLLILVLVAFNLSAFTITNEGKTFNGIVDKDLAVQVAKAKFSSLYNVENISVGKIIPMNDMNGYLYAYLVPVYFGEGNFPNDGAIEIYINENRAVFSFIKTTGDQKAIENAGKKLWGVDRFGYVIVSARTDNMPVLEIGKGIPHYFMNYDEMKSRAFQSLRGNVQLDEIIYVDHMYKFYRFSNGNENVYVDDNMKKSISEEIFNKTIKRTAFKMGNINEGWIKILNNKKDLSTVFRARATGYIPNVPFYLWSYGCSPTSSAMIFDYWDSRGYAKLTDYHFDRWDGIEGEEDYNLSNVHQELAIAMNTDTTPGSSSAGGTSIYNIASGQSTVASNNGYSCTSTNGSQGNHTYGWQWDRLTGEIDNGYPCHFDVLQYWLDAFNDYIGHSTVAVGYDNDGTDSLVQVHNTWDYTEPYWALYTYHDGNYSYHYFTNFEPSGGDTTLTGNLASNLNGAKFLAGKDAMISFENMASGAGNVKLYYSFDNFQNETLISNSVDPFNPYYWTTPNIGNDTTKSVRLRMEVYDGSNNLIATDGNYQNITLFRLVDTLNYGPMSFISTLSQAYSVTVKDTLAFICRSGSYMDVVDISALSTPRYIGSYPLPETFLNFKFINDTLIAASADANGFVVAKMDNSFNVTLVDSLNFNNKNVLNFVIDGNRAVIAAKLHGLSVVDITDPTNIAELGSYYVPLFSARDVYVKGDTAFVAAGAKGLVALDISDPTNITVLSSYDSPGISNAIAVNGDVAYVADGSNGTYVADISNASSISLITTVAKKSNATTCTLSPDGSELFVGDGSYYEVLNTANMLEGGYIHTLGTGVGPATALPNAKGTSKFIGIDYNYGVFIFDGTPDGIVSKTDNKVKSVSFALESGIVRDNLNMLLSLNKDSNITVSLFDATGRRVAIVYNSVAHKGMLKLTFNAKSLAKGLYFARVNVNGKNVGTKKVVILK